MPRFGVKDYADAIVRRDVKLEPARLARLAAKRLKREKARQAAKIRQAEELLAIERRSGVSARSWRAAILARVVAEEKARGK